MPQLSQRSRDNKAECHHLLQELIARAIIYDDFSVGEAHRSRERHERLREQGRTKVPYEKTMHRFDPSRAVHLIPYPSSWPDSPDDLDALHQFYQLHGVVKTVWRRMQQEGVVPRGVTLRWGGDWDGDDIFSDQSFDDLAHYELRGL